MKYQSEWTAMIQDGETVALISTGELAMMFNNAMTDKCIRLVLPYPILKPVRLFIFDQAEGHPGSAPTPSPTQAPEERETPHDLNEAVSHTIEAFSHSNVVVRVLWNLGVDSMGDRAIYFRIVLTDEVAKLNANDSTGAIMRIVYNKLKPENWGLIPYFSFRSESETTGTKDRKWSPPAQAGHIGHKPESLESKLSQALRELDSWRGMAKEMSDNRDYCLGLVVEIGGLFGVEARTQDDGGVVEDVLVSKVPELVRNALAEHAKERLKAGQLIRALLEWFR